MFVCDNLAFVGDHVIRRKHTVKAKRELPGLVTEIVAPLQLQRIAQNQKLLTYQGTPVSDAVADPAIMQLYRQEVIGVQRIADVVDAWERPQHDGGSKTAWRLFNAATFALSGKVAEKPDFNQAAPPSHRWRMRNRPLAPSRRGVFSLAIIFRISGMQKLTGSANAQKRFYCFFAGASTQSR